MKTILSATTALALLVGSNAFYVAPALAQQTSPSLAAAVGHWLYDVNSDLVGSVYAIADSGRTVVLQFGSYLTPGRHLVSVPAPEVAIMNGRATLQTLTAQDVEHRPSAG
jgi:hypothetical protein